MIDYGVIECENFKRNNPEEWKTFGCGPGGIGDYLVPDTMWGLDISEACRIHDWFYRFCPDRSEKAKRYADWLMLQNCLDIVHRESKSRIAKQLRIIRCHTYFFMVSTLGKKAWGSGRSVRDKG